MASQPRLLSINNYFYKRGGAEAVFLEQNRLLEEIGWSVAPLSMQHPDNLGSDWSDYFVEEIEFGGSYSLWGKVRRALKLIYSFEARRNVDRLVDRFRPDVAHAHNVYHHISPSIFGLLKSRGIPVVMTLHDLKLACPAYKMLTHDGICERCRDGALRNVVIHRCVKGSRSLSTLIWLESWAHRLLGCYARNVDRFVVPSRFYADKFAQWGWDPARFRHIPNFVDIDIHRPDFAAGAGFLYFGRLGPEKGLRTLVQAAAAAGVPLSIAGTGPEEGALRRLADEIRADIRFLGYRTGEPLHEAVRSARAVVLPSEWYENAPISVLEAYALGKPVIGAAIGGIPELIKDGATGWTFQAGDAAALAGVLGRVHSMPAADIAEMGREARGWVEAEYSTARYRDRLLMLYRELGVNC